MELIVIGENRLKIMLTGEDMAHYDLTEPDPMGQTASSVSPHTREVLRHIFADAHSEIGFDTDGGRLFVQLYASKGGGCEIFVTKLGETGEARLLKKIFLGNELPCEEQVVWLRISALDDLTSLCRRLSAAGFSGNSALYIPLGEPCAWFLSLTFQGREDLRLSFPFLQEYGEEIGREIEVYLGEYGKMICPAEAVEIMGRM